MNTLGKGVIAGAVVACIILFIGMCIFIAGFSIVDPTYMAISRNKMTSHIEEDKVYFEGRHYLGVGNEFILYPMAWQLIEFTDDVNVGETDYVCKVDTPLEAFTNDGLDIIIEVSFYFTIPPQQLINFYTNFGINYEDSLANECKTVLKNTAAQFEYSELFKGRIPLSKAMIKNLGRTLASRRCHLEKLLLRGIFFADNIESNIEESVCADQNATANIYKGKINAISENILTLQKQYNSEIEAVMAKAKKEASLLVQAAQADANALYANTSASAWKTYQDLTELDAEDLLRVQWARTLAATTSNDRISIGYDTVGAKFVQQVKNIP